MLVIENKEFPSIFLRSRFHSVVAKWLKGIKEGTGASFSRVGEKILSAIKKKTPRRLDKTNLRKKMLEGRKGSTTSEEVGVSEDVDVNDLCSIAQLAFVSSTDLHPDRGSGLSTDEVSSQFRSQTSRSGQADWSVCCTKQRSLWVKKQPEKRRSQRRDLIKQMFSFAPDSIRRCRKAVPRFNSDAERVVTRGIQGGKNKCAENGK